MFIDILVILAGIILVWNGFKEMDKAGERYNWVMFWVGVFDFMLGVVAITSQYETLNTLL